MNANFDHGIRDAGGCCPLSYAGTGAGAQRRVWVELSCTDDRQAGGPAGPCDNGLELSVTQRNSPQQIENDDNNSNNNNNSLFRKLWN